MNPTSDIVVYRARNAANGRCYIGVSKRGLEARRRQHFYEAAKGRGFKFHRAIRKYGEQAFVFEVLAVFVDVDLALIYECEAIAQQKPYYNMSEGGEGRSGPRSPETNEKIRRALKGRPSIYKGTKRNYGPKISAALKGRPCPLTPARTAALSVSILAAQRALKKPVRCLNDGLVYPSATDAGVAYSVGAKLIQQAVRRGQTLRTGLRFERVE